MSIVCSVCGLAKAIDYTPLKFTFYKFKQLIRKNKREN
ncbi:MAG: hypothetical protein ACI9EK_002697 [Psychroserpens sp.]|jgi:hypothetical protein